MNEELLLIGIKTTLLREKITSYATHTKQKNSLEYQHLTELPL